MIIAKVRRKAPTRRTGGSEFAYVARLSRYIVRADPEDLRKLAQYGDQEYVASLARYVIAEGRAEEVLATGNRGLLGKTLEDQQAEMMALMHRCSNSAGALDHWVMSWADGEEPRVEEIEEAIDIFLRCQKLERCPVIWGYHGDTENRHVHLALLRIDPLTGKRQTAGEGWDIDTAHRAKAVIEDAFPHWSREKGSLYEVRQGKLIRTRDNAEIGPADRPDLWRKRSKKGGGDVDRDRTAKAADIDQKLDQPSRQYEAETGLKSKKRIALEVAVPIAQRARTWDECHRLLAAEGIAISRTRYGANFVIDGVVVKASIDRSTSYAKLKARYGGEEFTPSTYPLASVPPRERWPDDAERRNYFATKRDHDARLKAMVSRFREGNSARVTGKTGAQALNAAITAAAFPSFEEWSSGSRPPDPAEIIAGALEFGVIQAPKSPAEAPREYAVEGFAALKLRGRVIYHRLGDPPGRPSFIDLGDRVLVNAAKDRDAVRAALLVAAKNNPGCEIAVFGDRAFKKLTLEIANEEGVKLHGKLGRKQERKQRAKANNPSRLNEPNTPHDNPSDPGIVPHEQRAEPSASPASPSNNAKGGQRAETAEERAKRARAAEIAAAIAAASRGL